MRQAIIGTVAGFVAGAAVMAVPPLVSPDVARIENQYIYDCGLRIADGVTIDGAHVDVHGRQWRVAAICSDGSSLRDMTVEHHP